MTATHVIAAVLAIMWGAVPLVVGLSLMIGAWRTKARGRGAPRPRGRRP